MINWCIYHFPRDIIVTIDVEIAEAAGVEFFQTPSGAVLSGPIPPNAIVSFRHRKSGQIIKTHAAEWEEDPAELRAAEIDEENEEDEQQKTPVGGTGQPSPTVELATGSSSSSASGSIINASGTTVADPIESTPQLDGTMQRVRRKF